ncbi:alpha- and gamma-adaptin-binding protein p34 [Calliopsis andreniformis]|uniref:alpha- and gamma-adaptin-binding protein p34 n=1 Tax=Calliopsis andreniformis TaxID=337506 RepID=UPI003FCDD27D
MDICNSTNKQLNIKKTSIYFNFENTAHFCIHGCIYLLLQSILMAMNLPRLLIVSTEKGKANEIATSIGAEKLSNQDYFEYYLWNIQNKYYKTQVLVCVTENPSQDIVIDGVEALIVHHDPQAENADQNFKQWSSLISSLAEAEVLLFSCNCITDVLIRDKVIKWCLQKKFELIELNRPEDASEADSEHNKYGTERIIEALHAHMWPNMTLKVQEIYIIDLYFIGKSSNTEEQSSDMNSVEEQFENIKLTQDSTERLPMENIALLNRFRKKPLETLETFQIKPDHSKIKSFHPIYIGHVFRCQLMAMKEHAASLPTNQRRIAAEQLVTAFWKAMGGDPYTTKNIKEILKQ